MTSTTIKDQPQDGLVLVLGATGKTGRVAIKQNSTINQTT